MKKIVLLLLMAQTALYAQEELKGSLYFDDGAPGRVSYIDLVIKGKAGMKMNRAITQPPYREQIVITKDDINYALAQISLDGVVTRDGVGNVIIVISATHRRVITPHGDITEVFESPNEFKNFFINYTTKYPKTVKATAANGDKKPYLALPLKKGALKRIYMRVIPYEEVCVIEAVNYPVRGYVYHEVRATNQFIKRYPNATYLEHIKDRAKFLPLKAANPRPVENGYFSFMQGVSGSSFNNTINVYNEQVREIRSKQDVTEISAAEMDKIFDGSLLNAEIIVGKGDALAASTYERIRQ